MITMAIFESLLLLIIIFFFKEMHQNVNGEYTSVKDDLSDYNFTQQRSRKNTNPNNLREASEN